jgi:hypothetical protein
VQNKPLHGTRKHEAAKPANKLACGGFYTSERGCDMREEQPKAYRVYQRRDARERNVIRLPVLYGVQKRMADSVWVDVARNRTPLIFADAAEAQAEWERLCATRWDAPSKLSQNVCGAKDGLSERRHALD